MAGNSDSAEKGTGIEVVEGDIPEKLKEAIEKGEFTPLPKEEVIGFITIAYVKGGGNPNPDKARLRYEHKNIPTLALPTLLRKVANDIEREIVGRR